MTAPTKRGPPTSTWIATKAFRLPDGRMVAAGEQVELTETQRVKLRRQGHAQSLKPVEEWRLVKVLGSVRGAGIRVNGRHRPPGEEIVVSRAIAITLSQARRAEILGPAEPPVVAP